MRTSPPSGRPLVVAAVAAMGFAACGNAVGIHGTVPDTTTQGSFSTSTVSVPADTTEVAPSSSTPTVALPSGHVAVLHWSESGGCSVLGPNCPTWVVYADGTVEVSRPAIDPSAETIVVDTGSVAPSAVEAVARAALATDQATIAASVGPGSCQSCVDGADITATVTVEEHVVVLLSTEIAFDPAHPLFAALERLMADVRTVSLPLIEQP